MIEFISYSIAFGGVLGTGYYWLKDRKDKEQSCIKKDVQELKTDMAVVKNDVSWIKDHLKNGSK